MPIFSPKELGALIGLEEGLAGRAAKRMTGAELDTKGLASADEVSSPLRRCRSVSQLPPRLTDTISSLLQLHGGVKVISEPLSNYWVCSLGVDAGRTRSSLRS